MIGGPRPAARVRGLARARAARIGSNREAKGAAAAARRRRAARGGRAPAARGARRRPRGAGRARRRAGWAGRAAGAVDGYRGWGGGGGRGGVTGRRRAPRAIAKASPRRAAGHLLDWAHTSPDNETWRGGGSGARPSARPRAWRRRARSGKGPARRTCGAAGPRAHRGYVHGSMGAAQPRAKHAGEAGKQAGGQAGGCRAAQQKAGAPAGRRPGVGAAFGRRAPHWRPAAARGPGSAGRGAGAGPGRPCLRGPARRARRERRRGRRAKEGRHCVLSALGSPPPPKCVSRRGPHAREIDTRFWGDAAVLEMGGPAWPAGGGGCEGAATRPGVTQGAGRRERGRRAARGRRRRRARGREGRRARAAARPARGFPHPRCRSSAGARRRRCARARVEQMAGDPQIVLGGRVCKHSDWPRRRAARAGARAAWPGPALGFGAGK